jgi:cold shock CspA family protein
MKAPLWEILRDLYHNGTAQWWERQKGDALIPPLERNYTVLVNMLMLGRIGFKTVVTKSLL